MPPRRSASRVLVLGGTHEARLLAGRLVEAGLDVVLSFAGRGGGSGGGFGGGSGGGFGGATGLIRWLGDQRVAAVVDGTHPFATRMSAHAEEASAALGIPRLRLLRPPWTAQAGDRWQMVADLEGAAAAVRASGATRVFLALGGRHLEAFADQPAVRFLVRAIEAPESLPLAQADVVLGRGPFEAAGERALLMAQRIELVVARNSGGSLTETKLTAARDLGLPVVMVQRPPAPPGPLAEDVPAAWEWCRFTLGLPAPLFPTTGPPRTRAT